MSWDRLIRMTPLLVLICMAAALTAWLSASRSTYDIGLREPGTDRPAGVVTTQQALIDLSGQFLQGTGTPGSGQGAWLGFRGNLHDGIGHEAGALLQEFPADGPKRLWEIPVGEGYAGAAVKDGRAYVLDYDAVVRADALRCLSLDDGKEIWRRSYPADVKRNHGMSRTVPAIGEGVVVSLGPKCQVLCVDAGTGQYKWGVDLTREYRTKVPPWYAGQCPLIQDGKVILAPGGSSLMVALDAQTGKVVWETPNPRGWEMTHTSIIPMEFGGYNMLLYCGSGGVAGVDAQTGKLLWDTTAWRVKIAAVASPVPLNDGRIFICGGYDAGSMMLQLTPSGNGLTVQPIYTLKADVFGSEQQTPIFYKGYLFGVIPGGQLVCLGLDGKPKWNSGTSKYGIGPYLIANDVIYLMNDTGTFSTVAADASGFKPIAQAKVFAPGHECWGPMALANGKLIVRDLRRMACLDISAAKTAE